MAVPLLTFRWEPYLEPFVLPDILLAACCPRIPYSLMSQSDTPTEPGSTNAYNKVPVPPPGNPPKSHRWWQLYNLRPGVQITKSEQRVTWGWVNYTHHLPTFEAANVMDDEKLRKMEDLLKSEHDM